MFSEYFELQTSEVASGDSAHFGKTGGPKRGSQILGCAGRRES